MYNQQAIDGTGLLPGSPLRDVHGVLRRESSRPVPRPQSHALLSAVVEQIERGETATARSLVESILDRLGPGRDGTLLKEYIFASALLKRLESVRLAEVNLYLRQFEEKQISLFNLLAQHLPTVSLSVPLANALLARFVADAHEVTLIDIGIGSGRQEVELLRHLAANGRLPRKLTVVGIEPDPQSLATAEAALNEICSAVGLDFVFHAVPAVAEQLSEDQWSAFGSYGGQVVVNAAFAAHHIRDGDDRDAVLNHVRRLDPVAVVLSEPNSDHHTASLAQRFENAWRHFGLTFQLIDELALPNAQKMAMKMFFAREIEDIVANAEASRCERHEPVESWVARLRRTGFKPLTAFGDVGISGQAGLVRVVEREGHVGLEYNDETLVAVICATSTRMA